MSTILSGLSCRFHGNVVSRLGFEDPEVAIPLDSPEVVDGLPDSRGNLRRHHLAFCRRLTLPGRIRCPVGGLSIDRLFQWCRCEDNSSRSMVNVSPKPLAGWQPHPDGSISYRRRMIPRRGAASPFREPHRPFVSIARGSCRTGRISRRPVRPGTQSTTIFLWTSRPPPQRYTTSRETPPFGWRQAHADLRRKSLSCSLRRGSSFRYLCESVEAGTRAISFEEPR